MFGALTPAVRALLIANGVMYVLQWFLVPGLTEALALWPARSPFFQPWQLVTYAFLHGGGLHLFLNMFALFMFGRWLEQLWGTRRFVAFYFASVLTAALTQLAVTHASGFGGETIGASGGVFGLLLAFGFYFPHQRLIFLLLPVPIPAWLFVTLYGILELVLGVTNAQTGVAHFAHLGGMVGGALMILYWRARGIGRG